MRAAGEHQTNVRGQSNPQPKFLTVLDLDQRVPVGHPLRGIKQRADKILQKLSPLLDDFYAKESCPSIPPEQLLKSRLLIALHSVGSETLLDEHGGRTGPEPLPGDRSQQSVRSL